MVVSYVALPARLIGVKRTQSRCDRLTTSLVSGVLGATVCAPPYLLGRLGLLMLGSSALLIPGIVRIALGVTLQAGAGMMPLCARAQMIADHGIRAHPSIHSARVAQGRGLKSLLFFLAFATLSTLFVLKDGPVMRAFINRHMGVPERDAEIVTSNVARSLRSYFLGVSIIAAFNGVVIGLAAWIVGVPLAGTIAVVTFVGAHVPFLGAWVAGAFAVLIAVGTAGTDAALAMAFVSLLANSVLQQVIQPFVMGATLSLNPLVVLVVTIGAGALFGMVGLTLAAPLTSAAVHIANELRARAEGPSTGDPAPAPSG